MSHWCKSLRCEQVYIHQNGEEKRAETENVVVMPSYSPDLPPCDFFLFVKQKLSLVETSFQ